MRDFGHIVWRYGSPEEDGYYLATWRWRGSEKLVVSELCYLKKDGWFNSRGYLDFIYNQGENIDLIAWMEMPEPASIPPTE